MTFSIQNKVLLCYYHLDRDGEKWFYATVNGEMMEWIKKSFMEFKDYRLIKNPSQSRFMWKDIEISERVKTALILTFI